MYAFLKKKKTFEKAFTSNWTEELFIVSDVRATKPITYKIKDLKGEDIKGTFYHQELQKTKQEIYNRKSTKETYKERNKRSICQVERVQ